jgi:hypothetical protein
VLAAVVLALAGNATAQVAATAPSTTVAPSVAGVAQVGQTLTGSVGQWSGTAPITFSQVWQRCNSLTAGTHCTTVPGATGLQYFITAADAGYALRIKVTATNPAGSTNAWAVRTGFVTAGTTGSLPSNASLPAVSGTPTSGQIMAATAGTWSGSTPMSTVYQWQRCDANGASCTSVLGATATSYTLGSADVGRRMRVSVTATNSYGSATAASAAGATVTAPILLPTNTGLPTISGSSQQAQTLTASPGGWSGPGPLAYAYQWQRCDSTGGACSAVLGATTSSYLLLVADIGKRIRVVITASNSAGPVSASSAATSVVTSAPGSSSRTVIVSGGTWTCSSSVDLDLVRVTNPSSNAIVLQSGCTGRIGRIEVDGVVNGDGIRIAAGNGTPAHDLVIDGGFIRCPTGPTNGTHQDGVQAGSGVNILLRNLVIDCVGSGGGNLFVQRINSSAPAPTGIVCDHCAIAGRHVSTVELGASVASGARNSLLCAPRSGRSAFINEGGTSPLNSGNTIAATGDARCSSLGSLLSWAGA